METVKNAPEVPAGLWVLICRCLYREEFLQLIRTYIQDIYYVGCYYPDFSDRMASCKRQLIDMGRKEEDFEVSVKCPLSKDSDKRKIIFATDLPEDSFFCRQEAFSPCCGEVALDTESSVEAFLPLAVQYTNDKVHGGLSVSISVKPASSAEEKIGNCFGLKRPIKSVIRAPSLNFTHMILAAPNSSNAAKMAKLWRRIAYATFQRRSTQGWLSFAGSLTKIASAFAANL
ncbi:hypothetical protein EAH_00014640 [Eimeria acervulina]|uniref:Uncharacterized protein n=1 Tax=Eimeria acervulina TaxID=5801 RepID=U6GJD7_EIMAC|nr:hypothetical protein EAH_00014640 [Eimeria acervulina]CDI80351.1 hypothetical protein EAH_00014640 [Eimeria acervulina]